MTHVFYDTQKGCIRSS